MAQLSPAPETWQLGDLTRPPGVTAGARQKRTTATENKKRRRKALTPDGVAYTEGLGAHASPELKCLASFRSKIGVDDEVASNGSSVPGQSRRRGVLRQRPDDRSEQDDDRNRHLDRQELRLVVTEAGDGSNYDRADWAQRTLTCK